MGSTTRQTLGYILFALGVILVWQGASYLCDAIVNKSILKDKPVAKGVVVVAVGAVIVWVGSQVVGTLTAEQVVTSVA